MIKNLTPREIAVMMLIGTVCIILLAMELSIIMRAGTADVAESRALLADITKMVIALTAGFFMGKKDTDGDEPKPPVL